MNGNHFGFKEFFVVKYGTPCFSQNKSGVSKEKGGIDTVIYDGFKFLDL